MNYFVAVLEWLIAVLSGAAITLSVICMQESALEVRDVFWRYKGNGETPRLRRLAKLHLYRDTIRAATAVGSIIGSIHLITWPSNIDHVTVMAKLAWLMFVFAMTVNVVLQWNEIRIEEKERQMRHSSHDEGRDPGTDPQAVRTAHLDTTGAPQGRGHRGVEETNS